MKGNGQTTPCFIFNLIHSITFDTIFARRQAILSLTVCVVGLVASAVDCGIISVPMKSLSVSPSIVIPAAGGVK